MNAIRSSAQSAGSVFLDLCDRMGFLVMDEMFDVWTVAKNPEDYAGILPSGGRGTAGDGEAGSESSVGHFVQRGE